MEKKYGLQLRLPTAATKPKFVPLVAHDDDEDEDTAERQIARDAARFKKMKQVEDQHKRAMEEDPNVFNYDAACEADMKTARARPPPPERKQESRYIPHLLKKKDEREKYHNLVYERKLKKEQAKEEHLFPDKEKFVTRAYKEALAEQQKLEAEERLREMREKAEDVTKRDSLDDFYRNVYSGRNVAFGAATTAAEIRPSAAETLHVPEAQLQGRSNTPPVVEKQETEQQEHSEAKQEQLEAKQEHSEAEVKHSEAEAEARQERPPAEVKISAQEDRKLREAAALERYLARKKQRQT